MRFSKLAGGVKTSPIITLAAEINEKIQRGEPFYNLTIGDFNPKIFEIPKVLKSEISIAYEENETNYPGAKGLPVLRNAVSEFVQTHLGVHYDPLDILVSSGARPLLYAAYQTIVDPGDKVVFPVPSWNNDFYTYLSSGEAVMLETTPAQNFMPSAEDFQPYVRDAALIVLCSPLNPTGTVMSKEKLEAVCDLVIAENQRRGDAQKPLYVIFDNIYWQLTFGNKTHYNAVALRPEMRSYAVFVDGLSKCFAATGVRVGWSYGPSDITAKMRSLIAHIGSWAPRAEQVASGRFLAQGDAVEAYMNDFRNEIQQRLQGFYRGFQALKHQGYSVDAIEPQAAMYLTVQLDLKGLITADGKVLDTNHAVHRYILDEAKVGLVPFSYFGASEESSWYRLSVGTCRLQDVEVIMSNLQAAISKLRTN